MKTLSPAWTWFAIGTVISCVASAIGAYSIVSGRLAQVGDDPALALPAAMVIATSVMSFFSLLVPMLALLGVVIVMIDGFTRGRAKKG
ncbi:hypothetical protein A6A04_06860 [Paramagnetospirillum marisnigri]|uniref:Uncharacterized protein n=1 Tax=Paramagnetospirillum marisnigri TaxID=1285242 RepID=A0A178MA00_9PROT|nr:hypothetical protein [Paramagnetospirillum marisnigri]OAN45611.1 hypothetical protein A6A04_06860 [Paramagnetospirillum marisnigri]